MTGFIIDSPWLPGFSGMSTLDYFSSDRLWLEANLSVVDTFPDILFLPGFWSEYGMCTEPSAFGSKCIWRQYDLPHADKVVRDIGEAASMPVPDPEKDGLLPFVIQRLRLNEPAIRESGHMIRFAVSRGPLNIASFLMGTTEFMMNMALFPEETKKFLETITEFICRWLVYQKESFPSIDGIFILDDLVGFIGEDDFNTFAFPALYRIFHTFNATIRFFHNDAHGLICSKYLSKIGINLFNFSFEHPVNEIRGLAGPDVVLLGNLPPRDVLGAADPAVVIRETESLFHTVAQKEKVIWSCGGGLPPGVPVGNLQAFTDTINRLSNQYV